MLCCQNKAHRYVSLTSADSSLGICPVRTLWSNHLQCKPAGYMFDTRCSVAGHPSFYLLKQWVGGCNHVKRAHSAVNFTRDDNSPGIMPVRSFQSRSLQYKHVWMCVDKRCSVAGHPSFYRWKRCGNRKNMHRICSRVSAEICAGTDPLNLFASSLMQYKLAEFMLIKGAMRSMS